MKPSQYKVYKGVELEAVNINWTRNLDHAWQVNLPLPNYSRMEIFYGRTAEEAFEKAEKLIDERDK